MKGGYRKAKMSAVVTAAIIIALFASFLSGAEFRIDPQKFVGEWEGSVGSVASWTGIAKLSLSIKNVDSATVQGVNSVEGAAAVSVREDFTVPLQSLDGKPKFTWTNPKTGSIYEYWLELEDTVKGFVTNPSFRGAQGITTFEMKRKK